MEFLVQPADIDVRDIVKYHAYLRKITRFNPTRGGESTWIL
jgi:hypothetical protein